MFPATDFLIEPSELQRLCSSIDTGSGRKAPKKSKNDPDWEPIHEATYSEFGVAWPPVACPVDVFRERESEVVYLVDQVWPEERVDVWTFFDANHTLQRTIKYPPHKAKSTAPKAQPAAKAKLATIWEVAKSPWKDYVPTLTAGSSIAVRCIRSSADGAPHEKVLRRLHALEAMALQGWAPQMYENSMHPWASVTPQTLASMAGNMWNSFAFMPLVLSIFGAVNVHTDLNTRESVAHVGHDGDLLDEEDDGDDDEDDPLDCDEEEDDDVDGEDRCVFVSYYLCVCSCVCRSVQHVVIVMCTVVIWIRGAVGGVGGFSS